VCIFFSNSFARGLDKSSTHGSFLYLVFKSMHVLKCDLTSVSFECLVFRGDKDSCGPDGGHGGGHPVHRRCLARSAGAPVG